MKRTFIIFGAVLGIAGAVFAGRATVFATASQLWGKPQAGGICIQLAVTNGLTSQISTTTGGTQATIVSNDNTTYVLFENSACDRPVYFH